jgi:predicted flap endonuclease-1-like 5' DNA nuclease
MDVIREYWWLIVIAVALVLAFILLRPKQRVKLTDSAPVRPHAATSDLAGDIIRAPVHSALDGSLAGDDLCLIKGVGPKFADALRAAGIYSFDQIAALTPVGIDRLDQQLGAFRGRIVRDRIVDQADYLARNDIDGFEQKFGKL